jgi:hypothetical protein
MSMSIGGFIASNDHLYGLIAQAKNNALQVGATTDNVAEGSNHLYFTAARGRSLISASSPINYNSSTGVVGVTGVTQNITVVTATTPSVLTSTLHFTNGVLTSVT